MTNTLGGTVTDLVGTLPTVLDADVRVELYGKSVKPGRKIGHVNAYGDDLECVRPASEEAANRLMGNRP